VLPPPRRAPVARDEVRGGRGHRRSVRGEVDLARAAAHARGRRRRGLAVLGGAVRGDQRGDLQRPDALRRRCGRRVGDRRELPRRVSRARLPPGGAVHRPRLRAAALGADIRARLRGAVVAVAVAARSARACGARRSRDRGDGRPLRRRAWRSAACGRVPGADDVRLLVPAAAPDGRAAARRAARGLGTAAPAAGGDGARGADGRRVGVALRGRSLGRRLARGGPAGCAVRPTH
jgi:hypothetical protein